jgi:Flp pilus assembly protein TadD
MPLMARCPTCGREVPGDANFCPACGASLLSPAIQSMIEDARRALKTREGDTSARYNLALAYKLGGADDLALQEFQRVAQEQPDFADVHYEIGLLHAKKGRNEQAVAALRRALEVEPDHARARRLIEQLQGR